MGPQQSSRARPSYASLALFPVHRAFACRDDELREKPLRHVDAAWFPTYLRFVDRPFLERRSASKRAAPGVLTWRCRLCFRERYTPHKPCHKMETHGVHKGQKREWVL